MRPSTPSRPVLVRLALVASAFALLADEPPLDLNGLVGEASVEGPRFLLDKAVPEVRFQVNIDARPLPQDAQWSEDLLSFTFQVDADEEAGPIQVALEDCATGEPLVEPFAPQVVELHGFFLGCAEDESCVSSVCVVATAQGAGSTPVSWSVQGALQGSTEATAQRLQEVEIAIDIDTLSEL
jgi:hypothetical protein